MKDLTFKRNIMVTPSKLKGVKPWAVFAGNENKMKDTFQHFHISASYFFFRLKAKVEITHWCILLTTPTVLGLSENKLKDISGASTTWPLKAALCRKLSSDDPE